MKFSDGLSFDLTGELRIEKREDGYYVIGRNMLCPVDDIDDGLACIAELRYNLDSMEKKK
jgi:hypothetical protein